VFRTNQGYATIRIPTKAVPGGVHLNTEARIFWEDIPYGLCILKVFIFSTFRISLRCSMFQVWE